METNLKNKSNKQTIFICISNNFNPIKTEFKAKT